MGGAARTFLILTTHPAIERVRAHATEHGLEVDVHRFPAGTHTAEDAARAIGCEVAQIVKSLVFVAAGDVAIVLVSGADRVDETKVASVLGVATARRATAKEARERTGFVVGGIPPFGHAESATILIDEAMLSHETVWAAAGLPDAVFPISPHQLVGATRARIADMRLVPTTDRA